MQRIMEPGMDVEGITELPAQIPAPHRRIPDCQTGILYRMRQIRRMELHSRMRQIRRMELHSRIRRERRMELRSRIRQEHRMELQCKTAEDAGRMAITAAMAIKRTVFVILSGNG